MQMARKGTVRVVLTVLLLLVFSAYVFAQPVLRTRKFWFAYLCGVFAVFFQFYAINTVYGRKIEKGRFYGFPVSRLSIYYLLLQLTASTIEITSGMTGWGMLVINGLLFAFPIIGFITTRTVQAEIARQDAKRKPAE